MWREQRKRLRSKSPLTKRHSRWRLRRSHSSPSEQRSFGFSIQSDTRFERRWRHTGARCFSLHVVSSHSDASPNSLFILCDAQATVWRNGSRTRVHANARPQHDATLGSTIERSKQFKFGVTLRRPQVRHGSLLASAIGPSLPVRQSNSKSSRTKEHRHESSTT